MDLELSDEQEAVRRLARDFVEREVAPHATAWDRAEEVDRGIVKKLGEPRDIVMQGLGWLAREGKVQIEDVGRKRMVSLCG